MNLLKSKNSKIIKLGLVITLATLIISQHESDLPGDIELSSGKSILNSRMVRIDNYANMQSYLDNKEFMFWEELDVFQDADEYPQGLCFTEDFVLISSYSGIQSELGKIKVYDKLTGDYLLSIGMDESSHLGGITYDGKNIWVCNSSKRAIERLSYQFLVQMVEEHRGGIVDARNLVEIYKVKNLPSCVTYHDGMLWVATHSVLKNGIMRAYSFNEEKDRLELKKSIWIPQKVQGVAFSELGRVYLSISYGRERSSYIKKYKSIEAMSKDVDNYMDMIELPPCSEGIVCENEKIYVLFESAGMKYLEGTDGYGKSVAPLNKILILEE